MPGQWGGWTFDVVDEVKFITLDGQVFQWPKERFETSYRKCCELENAIAVGAYLNCPQTNSSEQIRQQMETYASNRKESQPKEPSAGCIFKNPDGTYAGKLIDELGFEGASSRGCRGVRCPWELYY